MHPSYKGRQLLSGLIVLAQMLLATHAQAYGFDKTAEQYLIPGYRQLADATGLLRVSSDRYCSQPSEQQRASLQSHYRSAFLAWQTVQPIRFGPVQYLNRDYRFELWPDKRGSVNRHLGQLLADPELDSATFDITRKSAAVQGFSALEMLLFSEQPVDERSCRLIRAISSNLAHMALGTLRDWQQGDEPYLKHFKHPNPDNPMFESEPELAGQLLNSLYSR
ncbi:MAG: imelysin family protein [Candidatus Thiodiazotropha sp.]